MTSIVVFAPPFIAIVYYFFFANKHACGDLLL